MTRPFRKAVLAFLAGVVALAGVLTSAAPSFAASPLARQAVVYQRAGGILPSFDSVVIIGDSITEGQVATSPEKRWANRFAAARNATLLNQGIPGTVLENSADSGGSARANNMRDRFVADTLGANKRAAVVVAGGFNDGRYVGAPATFNATQYGVDLREMLNGWIIGGYPRDRIFVFAPYYITDAGLESGTAGFTGQTRSGFEAFGAEARAAVLEYGVWLYEPYPYMRDHGYVPDPDNIHPPDTGHAMIAAGAELNTTRLNTAPVPAIAVSSPGSGQIAVTITAPPSGTVTNYTVQYGVEGSLTFGTTQDVSGLSATWSGLALGSYRVRLRANFADGTHSAWVFADNALPVSAAGVFMYASFTATAGTALTSYTGEIGGTWTVQSGASPSSPSAISATGTLFSASTAGIYQASGTPASANYYVEADFVFKSTIAGDSVALAARMAPSANTFVWGGWSQTSGGWRIFKTVAGTQTQLGSTYSDTFTGGFKRVRLTVNSTTYSLSVDGVEVISVTDSSITAAGKAGVRASASQSSATGIHIDNLVAADL
jgi:hypothetical protein